MYRKVSLCHPMHGSFWRILVMTLAYIATGSSMRVTRKICLTIISSQCSQEYASEMTIGKEVQMGARAIE